MATMRDLTVRIRANADEFDAAMKASGLSARAFSAELRKLEQQEARREQAMTQMGAAMTAFGAAVVGGLGLAAKAAIGWESAWAGVTKTVDGSAPQMAALEESLRALARELPASHQEIAAVAEAAGQLGIKRESIVEFTRTMIDLGNTTNLTAEQAASSLARISNVMGTSQSDVDRFGSSLVDLGNNSATTEAEILTMAQRIAGAAKQVGMSEGDLLGVSAALSSVGIEAEAGGSAFSTFLIRMSKAVTDGGDKLEQFAAVAGMSSQEFAAGFRDDAAGAATAFVEGLGRIQASGGDTFGTLEQLGLSEIRLRDALLRSAGAGDLMARSIRTGNEAWASNSALVEEAAKRYETTEARMQIARNQVQDFAITVGETFTPLIGAASDKVGSWMELIRELPEPVVQAGSVVGALAGAASLAGGGFFLAAPKIAAFRNSIDDLGPRAQTVARGLQGFGSFLAGPWGIALGAATIAAGLFFDRKAEQAALTRELADAIEAEGTALSDNARQIVISRLAQEDLLKSAKDLGLNLADLVDAHLDPTGEAYRRIDDRLLGLTRNQAAAGREAGQYGTTVTDSVLGPVRELRESIGGTNEATAEAIEKARLNSEAMRDTGAAQGEAAGAAGGHASALGELGDALGETQSAAEGLDDALDQLTGAQITATEAEIGYRDAVQRLTESLAENGGTFDLNTEAGRRNMDALIGVAERSADYQVALAEQTGSLDGATAAGEAHRAKLIDIVAQSVGNRDEAARLVDAYLAQTGATSVATEATRKAEEGSRFYKDELGRLAGMASGPLRDAILLTGRNFDDLGGKHASAEDRARAQIRALQDMSRGASPELRAELARLAGEITNLPDGEFVVTAKGIYNYPSNVERARRGFGAATGAVLPGFTPGRDVHDFYSPTAGWLHLSGGEAVMRPEFTQAVSPQWVHGANAAARSGGSAGVREFLSGSLSGSGGQRLAAGGIVRAGLQPFPKIAHRAWLDLFERTRKEMGPKLVAEMKADMESVFSGGPPGRGVERWRPMVNQALGIMGQPAVHANATLRRMNQESGGNPNIVNKWDVNWRRGYPSVGLMQVIRPTYAANRHPAFDTGPYSYGVSVNPLSNTLASMRYALRRYGSLPAAYNRRGGYDDGGIASGVGLLPKFTPEPERVLSPRQTEAFERLVRVLDTHRGPPTAGNAPGGAVHKHYHLTVHDAGNGRVDLEAQFSRLELRAGL